MTAYPDNRCPSSCVVPDTNQIKRCVQADGHPVDPDKDQFHLWVEALSRADGPPILIQWSEPDAVRPDITGWVESIERRGGIEHRQRGT